MKGLLKNIRLKRHLEDRWLRLYRVAYSWCHDTQLAQDLTQDTIMKALKNSNQLRDEEAMDTWVFSILVNCWRDVCRKNKDIIDIDQIELSHNQTPEEESQRMNITHRVRKAVSALNHEHREIVTLVDLEQMSYKDVAEVLQIPIGTVMSRLCRARRLLHDALRDLDTDPRQARIRRIK